MTTQQNGIGWHFPPTAGGSETGWNDGDIANFRGARLASLAREVLQNSLDARAKIGEPVHVSFELSDYKRQSGDGWDELSDAIDACAAVAGGDRRAVEEIERAQETLQRPTLRFLRISDRNTTGLHGQHWHALVKRTGTTVKEQLDAGGSQGLGKSAPFLFSAIRTIFYWTRFQDGRREVEMCQGKAILMSHDGQEGQTQAIGFYGEIEDCGELHGLQIPRYIRQVERGGDRGDGTSLWIAGFAAQDGWQRDIAASVISNFFCAIQDGHLSVTIEPDREMEEADLLEIKADTLEDWYRFLLDDPPKEEPDDRLLHSRAYWEMIVGADAPRECQDYDFGHCELWIRVGEQEESNVALIRRTGMLITEDQPGVGRDPGLQRFPGLQPFAAVVRFRDPRGNELLRMMENPRHDRFEPDWLPDSERARGRRALKRVIRWIRDQIREAAARPEPKHRTTMSELAEFLPDIAPDSDFVRPGVQARGERALGGVTVIVVKPRKPPPKPPGPPSPHHVPLAEVRFLALSEAENRYRFSFTPEQSRRARIRLEEAGDSNPILRDDLRRILPDGTLQPIGDLDLRQGVRVDIDFTSAAAIGDRAWRITAYDASAPAMPLYNEEDGEA